MGCKNTIKTLVVQTKFVRSTCSALVMSDLPALAEIVEDGKTGLLYPPDNIEKLADIIEDLFNDKNKREALGEAATQWIAQNRTWPSVIKNVAELYRSLLMVKSNG